jgi:hypothetical protein
LYNEREKMIRGRTSMEEILKKAGEIVKRTQGAESYCVLALIDEDGVSYRIHQP